MKKIILLLLSLIIISSCAQKITPEDFFINEQFVLLNKYEQEEVINGQTRNIRTWEIVRINMAGDSLYFGIIDNKGDYTSCGQGIITDELWKTREVGSILFFDYINKDRFHKRPKNAYTTTAIADNIVYSDTTSLTIDVDEPVELKYSNEGKMGSESPKIINMNDLEIERRIMEIEREIESLNREKDKLKESLK